MVVYTFVDLAFKFKLLGQSKRLHFQSLLKLNPDAKETKDITIYRDNSIFEMYLYSADMRYVIHCLLGESLLQLSMAVNMVYIFYKIVRVYNTGV